jgi:hypothetical protein
MSFGLIVELKKYDDCTHVDAQINVQNLLENFGKSLQGLDATNFKQQQQIDLGIQPSH